MSDEELLRILDATPEGCAFHQAGQRLRDLLNPPADRDPGMEFYRWRENNPEATHCAAFYFGFALGERAGQKQPIAA